ncbi:hypothetical protein KKF81_00290 [Candidatus Micrarchaeota archaeon]|nr:hypothetical protein [Candidatus Micrarchaeota archaeon]MBU1165356.1 hypothetical protein [Candidatus Micrarchaeota archaeon]MBU1886480.1 hypothetical protein [Candidatus Micrarchaeota archaeon]
MKHQKYNISDSLVTAEWATLANMLTTLENGIEPNDATSRKLRAQLGVIRVIVYEKIRGWNGDRTIDGSFLIGMFKTMNTMEKEYEQKGVKKREFLIFLRLLLHKFKKQKMIVKKPFVTISEFGKMKEVIENENGHL